jgi:hypothetical protein
MSDRHEPERLHVVIGTPWKDAVIKFLEPSSPYAPWPLVPDARSGDGVVVVFDCEPRLVVTDVGRAGDDGDVDVAIAAMSGTSWGSSVPVSRIGGALESLGAQHILLEDAAAAEVLNALDEHRFRADEMDRFGRSSMAEAAVLLDSGGVCAGCDKALGLSGADAPETVGIWTVETLKFRPEPEVAAHSAEPHADDIDSWFGSPRPPRIPVDWPAARCAMCHVAMRDNGFESFLDYRFSRHPVCPRCGGRQTQSALFGLLPFHVSVPPWRDARGCCVTEDNWTCTLCMHLW